MISLPRKAFADDSGSQYSHVGVTPVGMVAAPRAQSSWNWHRPTDTARWTLVLCVQRLCVRILYKPTGRVSSRRRAPLWCCVTHGDTSVVRYVFCHGIGHLYARRISTTLRECGPLGSEPTRVRVGSITLFALCTLLRPGTLRQGIGAWAARLRPSSPEGHDATDAGHPEPGRRRCSGASSSRPH